MNIILIGLPGTGKSTVALAVAGLGFRYIDTDELIKHRTGKSIARLFEELGEEGFRDLESEVCRELKGIRSAVIATGGGIGLREDNRRVLSELGLVVHLTASYDQILSRIKKGEQRPLLAGNLEEELLRLMRARVNAYAWADYVIDTNYRSSLEVANMIVSLISGSEGFEKD